MFPLNRFIRLMRLALKVIVVGYTLVLSLYLIIRIFIDDGYWFIEEISNFAPFIFLLLFVIAPLILVLRWWWALLPILAFTIIGLFWFGPYYLPKEMVTPNDRVLNVVTFNISRLNHSVNNVEKWLRSTNAHLVLLQELPKGYATNGIINLKDRYPFQIREPIDVRNYGNMVLSKYPVTNTEYLALEEGEKYYWTQKLTINVGRQKIAVYNVHLVHPFQWEASVSASNNNSLVPPIPKYDNSRRDAQVRRLLTALKTEPLPFIVAGDFNMTDQAEMYDSLTASMHDAFLEAGMGMGLTWPIPVSGGFSAIITPLFRIDYILHSADISAIRAGVGPMLGSDHLPIYATLQFGPAPGTD